MKFRSNNIILAIAGLGVALGVGVGACGGNSTVADDPDSAVNSNNNSNSNIAECGDDVVDTGEQCDGADLDGQTCASQSLGTGDLACSADCTFDVSDCTAQAVCGDDVAEGTEACDGTDLRGDDCTDHGFSGGTLVCTDACIFDDSGCSNCDSPDVTNPSASNHVPAPETQGATETTPISADLFDGCGVDTSSVSMRITITPKVGSAQVLSVTPTVTGTGTNVTATYTHPADFPAGSIVEVLLTANDINSNTLAETWRFSIVDSMLLSTGGIGGVALANAIDESLPDTNFPASGAPELIGGASGSERRYLLRFSPAVPLGAVIFSATLSAGICSNVSGGATLDCYQLNADSNPAQSTWNNRTTPATWTQPGADDAPGDRSATMTGSISFNSSTTLYTWVSDTVTSLVANWAAGDDYFGIVCLNTAAGQVLPICSPYSNAPPKIELTFGPVLP